MRGRELFTGTYGTPHTGNQSGSPKFHVQGQAGDLMVGENCVVRFSQAAQGANRF